MKGLQHTSFMNEMVAMQVRQRHAGRRVVCNVRVLRRICKVSRDVVKFGVPTYILREAAAASSSSSSSSASLWADRGNEVVWKNLAHAVCCSVFHQTQEISS